ncbi:hypothetical protein CUMW_278430, partial [Citrus unshiu]
MATAFKILIKFCFSIKPLVPLDFAILCNCKLKSVQLSVTCDGASPDEETEMGESGIKPDLLTYTALIDSFGRTGNIEESLRLFNDMKQQQIRPSIYVYRSLIDNLKKMGKVDLAMTIFEEMNSSLSDLAGPKDFKRKA